MQILSDNLDGSKSVLDVVGTNAYDSGSLAMYGNCLCWMFSKTSFKSDDGLYRQNGCAVILDKNNLEQVQNLGQTSSHSVCN